MVCFSRRLKVLKNVGIWDMVIGLVLNCDRVGFVMQNWHSRPKMVTIIFQNVAWMGTVQPLKKSIGCTVCATFQVYVGS